ncbi:MAG: hypothetical protein JO301_10505 [Chitinophagaceae bacterium]|nr:hypothetical protein [Chitinophagaceae bacterium]
MEVHKHPHHVTHKKQWSEYLLEFAMLFLAVFLGFIAENIREGSVEKHREKEFMESLARDLATDIAAVDYGLPRKEGKNNAIDSFFMYFAENNNAAAISGKLFKTLRRTTWDNRIERNTITISQLKNAGNMRLIRNKSVADSIASYDMLWTEIELYRENYNATGTAANIYSGKLISAKPLLPLYVANQTEAIVSNIPDSLQIPINTGELNEHLNFMMTQKTVVRQQINLYNRLRARAVGLRALIKKEYDLKDE